MRSLGLRFKFMANALGDWKKPITGAASFVAASGSASGSGQSSNVTNIGACWLREPIVRSVQEEVVCALDLGDRNKASQLLHKLGNARRTLQADDFIHILRFCARKPDSLFVLETWQIMEEKAIQLTERCYHLIIRALCKGGHVNEAFSILSFQRENSDIYPTLAMYNNLLEASIELKNLDLVSKCLQSMEQQGVGKSDITYFLLLKLAVLQQDLSAAHGIWNECKSHYTLSILTLRKFVQAFTSLGDIESAYTALQQMVVEAFRHSKIATSAEGKMLDPRLDIPIPFCREMSLNRVGNNKNTSILSGTEFYSVKNSDMGDELGAAENTNRANEISFSHSPFSVAEKKLLRWSFCDIIHACANLQNFTLAEKVILQMHNLGLELSSNIYDGYIKTLVSVDDYRRGIDILKIMQQKNKKPFDSTLAVLSVSCSRGLELDLAENFLDQMSHCRYPYPYNALLEACDTQNQPERAVQLLGKMKIRNIRPDIKTYELMFSLFGNVNAPYEDGVVLSRADVSKRINAIEKDMIRHDIQHSPGSMVNLLKALGMEGMTKEMIQYLHVAEDLFSQSTHLRILVYNTVLHSLVAAGESHLAIEIFKSIISCGLTPDAATCTIMIDCCSTMKCYKSAFALISMMIRYGFVPVALETYTALIKVLLNCEDFNEALRLFDQTCSEGIQPDIVLCNTILRFAHCKGRIDVIELIAWEMHRMKIQPDPLACTSVFLAYAENGYYNMAIEALQVLCMRMISEQDHILEENRLKYENLLFDESLEAESRIVEVFRDSDSLTFALLYLRWCATLGFPISWSPIDSPWVKRLSSDYACRHCS